MEVVQCILQVVARNGKVIVLRGPLPGQSGVTTELLDMSPEGAGSWSAGSRR